MSRVKVMSGIELREEVEKIQKKKAKLAYIE